MAKPSRYKTSFTFLLEDWASHAFRPSTPTTSICLIRPDASVFEATTLGPGAGVGVGTGVGVGPGVGTGVGVGLGVCAQSTNCATAIRITRRFPGNIGGDSPLL